MDEMAASLDAELTAGERRTLTFLRMGFGLPALMVASLAIAAIVFGRETPKSQLVKDYSAAAEAALQDDRLDEADLFYRKVRRPGAVQGRVSIRIGDHGRQARTARAGLVLDETHLPGRYRRLRRRSSLAGAAVL